MTSHYYHIPNTRDHANVFANPQTAMPPDFPHEAYYEGHDNETLKNDTMMHDGMVPPPLSTTTRKDVVAKSPSLFAATLGSTNSRNSITNAKLVSPHSNDNKTKGDEDDSMDKMLLHDEFP